MALPPESAGALNAMVACRLPGVAAPMVGAPGTTGVMATSCVTSAATLKLALPGWLAAMRQLPALSIVTVVPPTVQTPVVSELYATGSPDVAVASGVMANVLVGAALYGRVNIDCAGKAID